MNNSLITSLVEDSSLLCRWCNKRRQNRQEIKGKTGNSSVQRKKTKKDRAGRLTQTILFACESKCTLVMDIICFFFSLVRITAEFKCFLVEFNQVPHLINLSLFLMFNVKLLTKIMLTCPSKKLVIFFRTQYCLALNFLTDAQLFLEVPFLCSISCIQFC